MDRAFITAILGAPKKKINCKLPTPNCLLVRLTYMNTWNERLDFALRKRNKKPVALAKALRVSQPTVWGWLHSDTKTLKGENLYKK